MSTCAAWPSLLLLGAALLLALVGLAPGADGNRNGQQPKASQLSLEALADSFWTPTGLKLPERDLVEAIQRAKLPVRDSDGKRREVVIMAIGSDYAFQKMFGIFLGSLARITFLRTDGTVDDLARHTIINVMTVMSMPRCRRVGGCHTRMQYMPRTCAATASAVLRRVWQE